MPSPTARKERSHRRIVEVAAHMVRERGVLGAGVDDVMNAAGLTRGGFYAHFEDKDALVVEAVDEAFVEARRNLFETKAQLEGRAWLERTTHVYLNRRHVDAPGAGCAIPALAADIARQHPSVRKAFTRNVSDILRLIDQRVRGRAARSKQPSARAASLLAVWVGGLLVARAVDDDDLRERMLAACRRTAIETVAGNGRKRRRAPGPLRKIRRSP